MYHISDLKKFNRCPRYYFLSLAHGEDIHNQYLRSDTPVIDLFISYLGIDNYYVGKTGDSNNCFFDNQNYSWFINTRLEDDGLRIKIPVIHKLDNSYDIYFLHHGISIKELDLFYYRLSYEVLRKLGIDINNVYIAYINGEYVRDDILDVNKLFLVSDMYRDNKLIDVLEEEINDYKSIIKRIESTSLDSYSPKKNRTCHTRNICPYYYECFKEETNLPNDSILTLVGSQYKEKMYQKGIEHLKDVDPSLIEGTRIQYSQIMASKNGGLYVDYSALKKWLEPLSQRPISFVDFEWDTYIVPEYKGMKALDVLPFEYVLYVLDEKGEMHNYSFLGSGDCRKELLEDLLDKLPSNGPILAYNSFGAECRRLEELGNIFPKYQETIKEINSRFVDMAFPFLEGLIYDTRLQGNFTLKKVVNIISGLDYHDMEISDGLKAVYNWRDIDKGNEDIDQRDIADKLIKYCSLDAYGLYLLYNWLVEVVNSKK